MISRIKTPSHVALTLAVSAVVICLGCASEYSRVKGTKLVLILGEERTWALAYSTPMPEYPKSSLRARSQGPAVANLLLARDGSLLALRILQAPDRPSADAFTKILSRWKFHEPTMPEGAIAEGTITVYFELAQGTGRIVGALDKVRERNPSVRFDRPQR